jgi:hypothetical protein
MILCGANIDLFNAFYAFVNSCVTFCGGASVANCKVGEGKLESGRARRIATALFLDHCIPTKTGNRHAYSGKKPYCFSYDRGHVSDNELVFLHMPPKSQEQQSDDSTSAGATTDRTIDSDIEMSDDDYPQYWGVSNCLRDLSEAEHADTHMRIEHGEEGFVVTQWVDDKSISVCVIVAQAADISAETCEIVFQLIHEARELLLDPDRRRYIVNSTLVVCGVGCLAFSSGALVVTVGGMAALAASLRGSVFYDKDSGRSYEQELCIGAVQGVTGALIGAGCGVIDTSSSLAMIGIKACCGAVSGICMQTIEDGIYWTSGSKSSEEVFMKDKTIGSVVVSTAIWVTAAGISEAVHH